MKEVAIRSMHIDLKGLAPKAEYAWKLMDDLQSFGYNHILMEFEDKFPFECCPEIVHQGAYTKAELAKFECKGLSVIPLMQCAGHLDYLLSHEKYAFSPQLSPSPASVLTEAPGPLPAHRIPP